MDRPTGGPVVGDTRGVRLMWVRYGVLVVLSAVALLALPVAMGHAHAIVRSGAAVVVLAALLVAGRVVLDARRGSSRHLGPQAVTTPRRRR